MGDPISSLAPSSSSTINIRLDIEYDGSEYQGWQRQPHAPTIQQVIEDTIEKIVGRKTIVHGASRTDSGVHARGQVATFYTDSAIAPERWSRVLNYHLPREIRVVDSCEVPVDFHPGRRALSKVYEYSILNRKNASALDRRVLFYAGKLDWDAMTQALPLFVGEKDFKGFQGAKAERKTTVRKVLSFELHRGGEGLYCFRIEGTGFLKQMVRTIVGTVLEVGEGKRTLEEIEAIFREGDRRLAGRTVPAHGLCLVKIRYPESVPGGAW